MAYRLKRKLVCYRIADRRFPLFSGDHAAEVGGRWNPRGRPAIYACTTYSDAMLEKLAQLGTTRMPRYQAAITISISAGLAVQTYEADKLPAGWNASEYDVGQGVGEKWLDAHKAVALIVPSVLFPVEHTVVINPFHPEAKRIVVGDAEPVRWDERLFVKR